MATVRITKELRDDILHRARSQFSKRREGILAKARDTFEPMKAEFAEDCFAAMLEQHGMPLEIYNAIPDGWVSTRSNINVRLVNDQPFGTYFPSPQYATEIKVPCSMANSYQSANLTSPKLERYAMLTAETHRQIGALASEEQTMLDTVKKLLTECTTLKQALEIWPHLMDLLPQYAIDKHNEKVEKRNANKPKVVIDADMLTGVLVKAKIAEAALR